MDTDAETALRAIATRRAWAYVQEKGLSGGSYSPTKLYDAYEGQTWWKRAFDLTTEQAVRASQQLRAMHGWQEVGDRVREVNLPKFVARFPAARDWVAAVTNAFVMAMSV